MATHWQSYRGGPTRAAIDVVIISISRKRVITLNRAAMKMLGAPDAVRLLFDEKNSVIGVSKSSRLNTEAFPVRPKNDTNWVINAAPFCRHFKISPDSTERFDEPELDDEGILRLDLKRTHDASLRKRAVNQAAG